MNYNFIPNGHFLGINFDFKPNQVECILGIPEDIKRHTYSSSNLNDYDIVYYYDKGKLRIIFGYNNDTYSGLSIYSKVIYINSINLFSINKNEVLNIIARNSSIDIEKACKDKVKLNDHYSEEYEFDDIGLTLWFAGDTLDEICIYK